MISFRELSDEVMEKIEVTYVPENADDTPPTTRKAPEKYQVWIDQVEPKLDNKATSNELILSRTRTLALSSLLDYLDSIIYGKDNINKAVFAQVLNVFLNHYAKSSPEYVAIGKKRSISSLRKCKMYIGIRQII